ncbi:DUF1488 domain-containing protein [Paraburkholderia sp. MM5384-R2]|uniref:DUF1488 domain-containing protein n=1 Tax=unclassified Paraburkholderia TaxID=2615204 RepID=UPI00162188AE|nr:DUF1488 domain-containing protein [Paraburkholderia sp. MM5384-R2]MBB5495987.1 hypothetical protein [Paraburkholderia sp. MM5384-R2]
MRITFPPTAPEYRGSNLTIGFDACVDGKSIDCAISAEALEDHFGAKSPSSADLLNAFTRHRSEIQNIARDLLHLVDTKQLLLHSGHFRFRLGARPDCV